MDTTPSNVPYGSNHVGLGLLAESQMVYLGTGSGLLVSSDLGRMGIMNLLNVDIDPRILLW